MGSKKYRARVYNPGSTDTSTGNVDYTITSALHSPIVVRHPTVLPLHGRTETQPWGFSVVDEGSSYTAKISDSSGRLDLLNRLVVVDRSTDGGSNYTRHGAGRISDVRLGRDVATYDYVCEACEHQFELFQSITANPKRKCPECGRLKLRRLIGPGAAIVFKGSGFYQTDYRSASYRKAAARDKKPGADGSSNKKTSGGQSKGEKKVAGSTDTTA